MGDLLQAFQAKFARQGQPLAKLIARVFEHLALLSLLLFCSTVRASTSSAPEIAESPPRVMREFRGAWVACVANLDWPSKPGLSTSDQQTELRALFDRATQLHLNAIIFQVRPACDALYDSGLEPWTEFLTGKMGQAPEPFYDPLAFAINEAHRRGLELHAWFNPFRVRAPVFKSGIASNHVSRTHADWVRSYGSQLWLDPGLPEVQAHCLEVILDVVKRYDIDGVHLDDYFYPYPERVHGGSWLEFPDESSWQRYLAGGGKLNRGDWRRENVNHFVQKLYSQTKAEKRWVKVGISPFGIWRPGFPQQVKGLDAYAYLYADSKKWLNAGWVDYLSPQLYWGVQSDQGFGPLLHWWAGQNSKTRHLWPGSDLTKVGSEWRANEIVQQVRITRKEKGPTGNVLFSMSSLLRNNDRISDALLKQFYGAPALVPPSPWLGSTTPAKPEAQLNHQPGGHWDKVSWSNPGTEPVRLWLYQTRCRGRWTTTVLSADQTTAPLPPSSSRWFPDLIAVTALDRCGVASPATLVRTQTSSAGVLTESQGALDSQRIRVEANPSTHL